MRTIIAVIYVILFLIVMLPIMGVEWIIGKFNRRAADISQLRIVQWAFRCVMFICGVKLVVKGKENIPIGEPVLYIGNHRSFFDTVTTYSLCPDLTGYIAKDGVNKVPILGMVMKRLYCLFLKRDDPRQGLKVILTAIEYVKQGISINIFPEGTRNKDKEHPETMLPYKEGSFKVAQKSGCKILPMAITGTADILENHFPWVHKGTVVVRFGEPIVMSELDKNTQKHIGVYCQQKVLDMLSEELGVQARIIEPEEV